MQATTETMQKLEYHLGLGLENGLHHQLAGKSRTAIEIVAWCTSSPIYLASFMRALLVVGHDANDQTYFKNGRPFMMRLSGASPVGRKFGIRLSCQAGQIFGFG